ncbi:MAG: tetratricopeptide repeat protein [Bacteroidia bacterium]|jgi:Tfp pilus assembly protein PilF
MEMHNPRMEKIQQMLNHSPDDLFLIYALGMEYVGHSDLIAAAIQFRKVLDKDHTYVPAYYQLGLILQEQGHEKEAKEIIAKGLSEASEKKDTRTINEFRSLLEENG